MEFVITLKYALLKFKNNVKRLGVMGVLPYFFWPFFYLVVTFFIYKSEYAISYKNVEYETTIDAYNIAEDFKDYLNDVTLIVDTASEMINDMIMQGQSVDDVQAFLERKSQNLDSIISGDTKGIYGFVLGTYVDGDKWVPDESYVPTERVWYKKAVEADGVKVMIDPYIDARTGKYIVTAAKLLPDKKSVLAIDIWLSRMQEMTESVGNIDENHAVMIMDHDGNVIAHSSPEEVGQNYRDSDDVEKRNIYESWTNCNGQVFKVKVGDVDYLLYPKDISKSWTVITLTSAEPAMRNIRAMTRKVVASAAVGLIITFIVLISISAQKIRTLNYGENIQSIANIYKSMQKINFETKDVEVISYTKEIEKQLFKSFMDDDDNALRSALEKLCDIRSGAEIIEFINLSTLNERMESTDSISIEFLNAEHLWCRGRFIAADRLPSGELKSVIWAVEEIDKEKRSREKLRYLANIDHLTKINNRGSGEEKIKKLIKNGEGGMFILFDVDRFKSINDTFGHAAGDKVLVAIGECMVNTFRDKDIAMRLGGDEFAAYTPSVLSVDEGKPIIERLIASVNAINIPELDGFQVNISVGGAFYRSDDNFTFDELYRRADSCTYSSKKVDQSYVTFYEDNILK